MDVFSKVQQTIAASLNVSAETVQFGSKASEFPNWDSLRHLILIMEIEQAFGCKFDLEEIATFDSVDKIVAAVQQRTDVTRDEFRDVSS